MLPRRRISPARRARIEALEPRRLLAGIALDTRFGDGGKVVTDLANPGTSEDAVADAAAFPDGKVVVVGGTRDTGLHDWTVTRYTADGALDPAFGAGGTARYKRQISTFANAVVALPDGKVLVGGYSFETFGTSSYFPDALVARYNTDGSLDPTFGVNGVAVLGSGIISSMALLPDGKILAAGHIGWDGWDAHGAIWRVKADGTPDTTFGANGRVTHDQGLYRQNIDIRLVLPDGRFMGTMPNQVALFRADGSIERPFADPFARMVQQPDGKFVGVFRVDDDTLRVVRHLPSGALDPAFGPGGAGHVAIDLGGSGAQAGDLLLQPDGKIIIGGTSRYTGPAPESGEDMVIVRLLPDGSPDEEFGIGGRMFQGLSFGTSVGFQDYLSRLFPAAQGRLMVVGATSVPAPEDVNQTSRGNLLLMRYALDAPLTADPGGPYGPVDEGSDFTASAARSSYANGAIQKYEWDVNFNGRVFTPDFQGALATLRVADDDPLPQAVLRVTTTDGLQAVSQPLEVTVRNVAPALTAAPPPVAVRGVQVQVPFAITDPGADLFTGSIDYGDGTPVSPFTDSARNQIARHTYTAPGSYTMTIRVSDDDGGVATPLAVPVEVSTLAGVVYEDANDNGRIDAGEPPRAGVSVYIDLNRNGERDPDEPPDFTDADGVYRYASVPAGVHRVVIVPPPGRRTSTPAAGYADVTVTNAVGARADFGVTDRSRIAGAVFEDVDGDGVIGTGDRPVANLGAYIDLNDDGIAGPADPRSAFDPSRPGGFEFRNLGPGTYKVRLLPPTLLFTQTIPPGNGGFTATVAGPAQVVTLPDFGVTALTPAVSGALFDDLNGNGTRQSGEPFLPGRTVYLDGDNDGRLDPGETSVVTDSLGKYLLTRLAMDTHTIRQVLPAGWEQTSPLNGSGRQVEITSASQHAAGQDFGSRHLTDHTLPAVQSASFDPAGPASRIRIIFTEDVSAGLAASDLLVRNIATGEVIPTTLTYEPPSAAAPAGVAVFSLTGTVANGNYRASVSGRDVSDAAGNPMNGDYALDFFALAGDINRDRQVNGTDFAILAGNFGRSGAGITFATGDLNGDGTVDGADFAILAGNFGRIVPPSPAAATTASSAPAVASQSAVSRPKPVTPAPVRRAPPTRTPRKPPVSRHGTRLR